MTPLHPLSSQHQMHLRKTKDTIFEGKFGNLNYIRTRSALHSPAGNRTRKEPRREMRETDGRAGGHFQGIFFFVSDRVSFPLPPSYVRLWNRCRNAAGNGAQNRPERREPLFDFGIDFFSPSSEIFQCHKLQTPKWPHGVAGMAEEEEEERKERPASASD